jgi:hypothetical protein
MFLWITIILHQTRRTFLAYHPPRSGAKLSPRLGSQSLPYLSYRSAMYFQSSLHKCSSCGTNTSSTRGPRPFVCLQSDSTSHKELCLRRILLLECLYHVSSVSSHANDSVVEITAEFSATAVFTVIDLDLAREFTVLECKQPCRHIYRRLQLKKQLILAIIVRSISFYEHKD